jgi:hypothetical protein
MEDSDMDSDMNSAQTPESVAARLRDQYGPMYLTLTSIIQGVALSTLVVRVEGALEHFGPANWLMATATLLGFLLVWHEYLMQAMAYVWMPTLLDSVFPFAFLVVELFLAYFVYGNQRAWLLVAGLAYALGVVAWILTRLQVRAHVRENVGVVTAVSAVSSERLLFSLLPAALLLGAGALYDALGLDQVPGVVAAVSLVVTILVIGGTVPYWNRVLAYARTERRTA